jgi:hypothetical protein
VQPVVNEWFEAVKFIFLRPKFWCLTQSLWPYDDFPVVQEGYIEEITKGGQIG